MNVALIGYGKMGKEIERLAKERNINITAKLNSQSPAISVDLLANIDVGIHFATPSAVLKYVEDWAAKKKPLVIGTTGWHNELEQVRKSVAQHKIGLVYASNFSIGVNIFQHIVKRAGKAFNKFSDYDVSIDETHHAQKLDSPSGTALTIARTLLDMVTRKTEIISTPPEKKIEPHQLHITSNRIGTVVGTHRIVFESDADQIELIHTAKNRAGFALGALLAAEWIRDKNGLFTMDDVLGDLLQ